MSARSAARRELEELLSRPTTDFKTWFVSEPRLEVGQGESAPDPKVGLQLYGPCGTDEGPPLSEIRVGIIGSGGEPDRIYLAVLATGVVGSIVARFRPRGMAWAMAATSAATVVVGAVALLRGDADLPGASVAEIVGLTLFFAVPWAASAWFFLRSAEWRRPAGGPQTG